MEVRVATPDDAEAIAAIWNAEILSGVSTFTTVEKTPQDVARAIKSAEVFLVAAQGAAVLGFGTYGAFRGGPGYSATVEHTVYLTKGARGCGLGRRLMERLETVARAQGHHVMVAAVGSENAAGVAFHKALGFQQVGRLPQVGRKFDRWMDLILLQKML